MKKQLLSILLCLIMVVGLLPTAALAEEAAPVFNSTGHSGGTSRKMGRTGSGAAG